MTPFASSTTDHEGRVTLSAIPHELLREVCVSGPDWGRQQFDAAFIESIDSVKTLQLRRVGSISGSIGSGPPELRQNTWLSLKTDSASLGTAVGTALVKTDDEGRFHVPRMATGELVVACAPRIPHKTDRLCVTGENVVHEDRLCELVVPIVQGRPFKGRVITEDARVPVAGVTVSIRSSNQLYHEVAVTDHAGEFKALVVSRNVRIQVINLADHKTHGYPRGQKHVELDSGIGAGTGPDILLPLQIELSGRVIDADGKPIPGRLVVAGANQEVVAGPTNDQGYFDIALAPETDFDQWCLWQLKTLPPMPLKIISHRPLMLQVPTNTK